MLDFADLGELYKLDRPDLKNDPWLPQARPPWNSIESAAEQFSAIRAGDLLVHHPYDSFASSFESYVDRAAADPQVIAIKSTVYRTSDDTPLVPALIDASERGKQTVCLVEIKARGDERRNIEWSRSLEQAGVHIVYGFPGLKIHAKTTLVVRREAGGLRRYVHLGTGNYNAVTARSYEDFGLFTADEDIAADVADLFNHLTGFGRPGEFRKLLVAPFTLRERLVEEIRLVAEAAAAGKKARIRIKVNGLTHPQVIDELYAASAAGARIDLLVRGVCSLRPGVPELSENIRVRSVIGRFLEHSRLFSFDAADRSVWFMGSADLMPRNLDHRVEVVTPIEDPAVQAELGEHVRGAVARHRDLVRARRERRLAPRRAEEGRASTLWAADADAAGTATDLARPGASPRSLDRSSTVSGPSPDRYLNVYPSSDRGPTMSGDADRSDRRRFQHDTAAGGERRRPTASIRSRPRSCGCRSVRRSSGTGSSRTFTLRPRRRRSARWPEPRDASASTRSTSFSRLPAARRATPPSSSRRCRGRQESRHVCSRRRRRARSPTAAPSSPRALPCRSASPSATSAERRRRSPSAARAATPTGSSPSISVPSG